MGISTIVHKTGVASALPRTSSPSNDKLPPIILTKIAEFTTHTIKSAATIYLVCKAWKPLGEKVNLDLSHTKINDEELANLINKYGPRFNSINLSRCVNITAAGLKHVGKLQQLTVFNRYTCFKLEDIPLVIGMSCYAECAIGRDMAVRYYLHPLIFPPVSIRDLIKPLKMFVLKESREDPKFKITIKGDDEDTEHLGGRFLTSTGNIDIFYPRASDPLSLFQGASTKLIHEVCHKIINKLVWNNQHSYPPSLQLKKISAAAQADMESLKNTLWLKAHISMHQLRNVWKYYSLEDHAEEYFVRIPEILFIIANEHPARSLEKIEEILNTDIPCLYKIYKEEFLPALIAYNNNLYKKPAKLPPSKIKKPALTYS